ncbi:MAG: diphthine--ammonia ligase [Nitrososphaeraceae archaeon]
MITKRLNLAALFSGGKDSTYSIYKAKLNGFKVKCLITIHPKSDESYLFHYPNIWISKFYSEILDIPLIDLEVNSNDLSDEIISLDDAIKIAKEKYQIDGIIHGGISSNFQLRHFKKICSLYEIKIYSPLWHVNEYDYMKELINIFRIKIVSVSAMGLDYRWLGKCIDKHNFALLSELSKKYKFNIAFEGGEAETLVIDCPLFKKRLEILDSKTTWDGQRGMFEILEVSLKPK